MSMQRTNLYMAGFWLLMFGAMFLFFTQYDSRQKTKYLAYANSAGELVIPRGEDGHYHVQGEINHVPVDFLVDTGATSVTISEALAAQAGLSGGTPITSQTANGALRGRLLHGVPIQVGHLVLNNTTVGVGLTLSNPKEALLGQSFLNHFDIEMRNNQMVLRAQKSP